MPYFQLRQQKTAHLRVARISAVRQALTRFMRLHKPRVFIAAALLAVSYVLITWWVQKGEMFILRRYASQHAVGGLTFGAVVREHEKYQGQTYNGPWVYGSWFVTGRREAMETLNVAGNGSYTHARLAYGTHTERLFLSRKHFQPPRVSPPGVQMQWGPDLTGRQLAALRQQLEQLPPSQPDIPQANLLILSYSPNTGQRVTMRLYDRAHLPAPVRALYQIAHAPLERMPPS